MKTTEQDKIFLSKINQIIDTHLDNPNLNADYIAVQLFLSRSQLYRKIQAHTQLSVAIYVRNYRLQKAKEMLQETDHSIREIAFSCGFNHPKYFSRVFSERYAYSPSNYRENLKIK